MIPPEKRRNLNKNSISQADEKIDQVKDQTCNQEKTKRGVQLKTCETLAESE